MQEHSDKRNLLCANVVLDREHAALVERVANKVYEDARSGRLKMVGFPDYAPVITALQDNKVKDGGKEFQVSVRKGDRLVILQAMASKWLESEFKDEATLTIEGHNAKFNINGEYWHEVAERWGWVPTSPNRFVGFILKFLPTLLISNHILLTINQPGPCLGQERWRCGERSALQENQTG